VTKPWEQQWEAAEGNAETATAEAPKPWERSFDGEGDGDEAAAEPARPWERDYQAGTRSYDQSDLEREKADLGKGMSRSAKAAEAERQEAADRYERTPIAASLGAVGEELGDAVTHHLPGAVAAAVEGREPAFDGGVADSLISRSRDRTKQRMEERKDTSLLPGIDGLGQSVAFSGVGMVAGAGTGIAAGAGTGAVTANPIAGTVAAWTAGTAASGGVAYRMATNGFVRDLREAADEESIRQTGKPMSDADFTRRAEELAPLVREYGLWEAVPEAAGNAVGLAVLKAGAKDAIGRMFGENVLARAAKKAGAVYGSELATETITEQGQHNVTVDALGQGERRSWTSAGDLGESFKDVAPQTILQTTLLAGGTKASLALRERIKNGGLSEDQANVLHQLNADVEAGQIDPEAARLEAVRALDPNGAIMVPAPVGVREQAAQTVQVTPEDEASPIPTELIRQGRQALADADASQAANEILDRAGMPGVNTRVVVDYGDGRVMAGTVVDAFHEENAELGAVGEGVKIKLDNGRTLADFFDTLAESGVKIAPEAAPPGEAVVASPATPASQREDQQQAAEAPRAAEPARADQVADTTGLASAGAGMASGINASMYDMLWAKVEAGDTTEAGAPSTVLQVAKAVRDRGGNVTRENLPNLAGMVAEIKGANLLNADYQQALNVLVDGLTPNQAEAVKDSLTTAEATQPATVPSGASSPAVAVQQPGAIDAPLPAAPVQAAQQEEAPAAKPAPKAKAATPKPVDAIGFLAGKGGIRDDEGHDLKAGRGMQKFVPRKGPLIRSGGMSIDQAGEYLWEAGYFGPAETTDRPTESQVLDFLERATKGKAFSDADRSDVQAIEDDAETRAVLDANAQAMDDAREAVKADSLSRRLTAEEIEDAARFMAEKGLTAEDAIVEVMDRAAIYWDNDAARIAARNEESTDGFDIPFFEPAGTWGSGEAVAAEGRPAGEPAGGAEGRGAAPGERAGGDQRAEVQEGPRDLRGVEIAEAIGADARPEEAKAAETTKNQELLRLKGQQSKLRKGGQESVRDQAGGLFAAERDQGDLLAAPKPKAEAPKAEAPQTETKPEAAEDIGALFDDVLAEERAAEAPAAEEKPAPKKKYQPKSKREATDRSAGQAAVSAAKNAAMGLDEIASGLTKLFGAGKTLGAGPAFDAETYAQAKPFFIAGVRHFQAAGQDIKETIRILVKSLRERGMSLDVIENMKPYVVRFIEDVRGGTINLNEEAPDAQRSGASVEQDRQDRPSEDSVGDAAVRAERDAARPGTDEGSRDAGERGSDRPERAGGVPGDGAASVGSPSDRTLSERESDLFAELAEHRDGERGGDAGRAGSPADERGANAASGTSQDAQTLEQKRAAQRAAASIPVKLADRDNIAATLPYLRPEQHDDVLKAETRFDRPGGHGMLFTNGTGTGKTFTGGGIVSRFVRRGKDSILIAAPSQDILLDWQKALADLGVKASVLGSTQDAGKGVVLTTYANLGENRHLAEREWDLVVPDESQKLMSAKDGSPTTALDHLRAITNHPRGLFTRADMVLRDQVDELADLKAVAENKLLSDEQRRPAKAKFEKLYGEYQAKRRELVKQYEKDARSKVAFLSATPFAYVETVDYAEGYLFDYPAQESRGYNQPDGRGAFFMQHFGYRMRTGKLTKPDASVNAEVMEREFHEFLRREGSLSGRVLDVEADYDRKFVLVDDAIGNKIDQLLEFLREADDGRFRPLHEAVMERFDYLARMRLLEAIKAHHAVPYIRKQLALGRRVVVFHDYNEGGGFNPFLFSEGTLTGEATVYRKDKTETVPLSELYEAFIERNPDVRKMAFADMKAPIETLTAAFPDALVYNGRVPGKKRTEAKRLFNIDGAEGRNLIIVQSAAGEAGISLHDTTGQHQRVLVNLGQPVRPTTAIQEEGRIYRVGQVTDAIFRYFNTGTTWERWTFAGKIAERAGTAENLALGNLARTLKQSFIDAFTESDVYEPEAGEGKGGKARDRANDRTMTPFERAKTFYWAQQKLKGKRDQRQGLDYFPTPEPIGQKMVEWADIRVGDKVLEPSAGHGAIARWFPEFADRTIIEPSAELATKAALASPGAKMLAQRFEDLHVNNKYDAIVMNPPYGLGGKTAIEHLAMAAKHLRNGGRIVALIPTGPAATKRFDEFMESDAAEHLYLVKNVDMPTVTFERAGTGVSTRIVVLERQTDPDVVERMGAAFQEGLVSAGTINELFDRIEPLTATKRLEPTTKEIELEVSDKGTVTVGGHEFKLFGPEVVYGKKWAAQPKRRIDGDWARVSDLAKKNGGAWDKYSRQFEFETEDGRREFLVAIERGDVVEKPAAPAKAADGTAAPTSARFDLAETKHGKTGEPLFVASIGARVERSEYDALLAIAKKHGGWYSSFRGNGAIPGFQFKKAEGRAAFLAEVAPAEKFSMDAVDTESAGFKRWFSGSKVVDADGKPLRVYHGTRADVGEFDASKGKQRSDAPLFASFFTNDAGTAGTYARGKGANIAPVYLAMKNPLEVDLGEQGGQWAQFESPIGGTVLDIRYGVWRNVTPGSLIDMNTLAALASQQGYDGLIVKNVWDSGAKRGGSGRQTTYAVFSPTQVKSAISNTGAFSDTDPRIQFSLTRADIPKGLKVEQMAGRWAVVEPSTMGPQHRYFDSEAEAIAYAVTKPTEEALRDRLAEVGIGDTVAVKLVKVARSMLTGQTFTSASGLYSQRLIQVVAQAGDRMGVLNHEIIHALRDLNILRGLDWKALEKVAKADAKLMAEVERRWGHLELDGISMTEEAVAELFREWATGKSPKAGMVARAYDRVVAFFKAARQAFKDGGLLEAITTGRTAARAERVMQDINRGALARKNAAETDKDFQARRVAGDKFALPPSGPVQFDDEASERRWQDARRGVGTPGTLRQRVGEWLGHIANGFTRHYIALPNIARYADVHEQLRKLESAPQASKEQVVRFLRDLTQGMTAEDMDLFTRKVVFDDLTYEVSQEHALPFGLTPESLEREAAKVDAAIAARPDLEAKVRQRQLFTRKIANLLVDAGVLHKDSVKNPAYYRHQVLDYARAQVAYAKGAGKKVKTPHWATRHGSELDINANLLEAEFDWLHKALTDISTAKTIGWIKRSEHNIRPAIVKQARDQNAALMQQALDKDLKDNGTLDDKGRDTSPMNEQWKAYKKAIAMGLDSVGKAVKSGKIGPIPAEFQAAAAALSDKDADGDGENLFPFLSWLLDNDKPGAMGAAQAFKAVVARKAFVKEVLGERYTDPANIDQVVKRFAPAGYVTWQPDEGKLLYTAKTLPEHVIDRMMKKIAEGGPVMPMADVMAALDSVRPLLAVGGQKYEMVLPEELAATLNSLRDEQADSLLGHLTQKPLALWKQWTLMSPRRWLTYNINNTSGDLDAALAGNPSALKRVKQASRELYQVMVKKQAPSARYLEAVERGVFDSGISMQEIPDINSLSEFEALTNPPNLKDPRDLTKLALRKGWGFLRDSTQLRENVLRYALYLDYVERLEAGEDMSTIGYGATKPEIVDAVKDVKDRAALLARDTIGDYGNVSHYGRWLRTNLLPFYSWMEVNTKRYWRLSKNAWGQGIGKGLAVGGGLALAGGARTTGMLVLRMAMLYGLVTLWNNLVFGDEEDELDEAERMGLHIILGRYSDGTIRTLRFNGAFPDFLNWIGFEDAARAFSKIESGRASWGDVLTTIAKAPANKVGQGLRPDLKLTVESLAGERFFPDIFNPRPLRDGWRNAFQALALENEYDAILDKPSKGYLNSWLKGPLKTHDTGEVAYNKIRGLAGEWLRKKTGAEGVSAMETPRSNALRDYKTARRYGDVEAARKAEERMRELGITAADRNAAIKRAHPLGGIPIKDRGAFLQTLTPKERESLSRATEWYGKTFLSPLTE
jgi:hypothetical protein